MADAPPPRPRSRNRWVLLGRGVAGAAVLIGLLATRSIDWGALLSTLRAVDPALLAGSAAGFLLLMAAKTWRWTFLLRRAGLRYRFWPAYRAYMAAFALGTVTPGRLGELARAAKVRRDLGAELGPCLRSVVSDRLLDLVFLLSFGPFALWAIIGHGRDDATLAAGFLALNALAVASLAAAGKLAARWSPRNPRVAAAFGFLRDVADDLAGRAGLLGSAITLVAYGVYFATSQVLMLSLGFRLAFLDVACVMGCLSLILLLPISIAGIGPREASLVVLLGRLGLSAEDALACSTLQFAVFTLFGTLIGSLALVAGTGTRTAAAGDPPRP